MTWVTLRLFPCTHTHTHEHCTCMGRVGVQWYHRFLQVTHHYSWALTSIVSIYILKYNYNYFNTQPPLTFGVRGVPPSAQNIS
jgi:hypothetical protein